MAKINFGGVIEDVITSKEFSLKKAQKVLKKEVVAVLGYGVQGPAQAFNMRDNGINVIIGQAKEDKRYWKKAIADGWVPGKTLFPIEEAVQARHDYSVSCFRCRPKDSLAQSQGQSEKRRCSLLLARISPLCIKNRPALFRLILWMLSWSLPKDREPAVRRNFLDGSGINSSFAVHQDATGRAMERTLALGIAIGSGFLFPTTFQMEVYSDLTGERGVLMGALAGMMEAQYNELRKHGHTPSEAFNETVEELTQSLIRLVAENGMDWMYANCSATAQRGALDWRHKFRKAVAPVFAELYKSVATGKETEIVLRVNSAPDYKVKLEAELKEMRDSELWQAGAAVRALRPEKRKKK